MPTVKLINFTPFALETLIYTKNTRLQGETSIEEIRNWSHEQKMEHIDYIKKTIKSSWEFIDYIFHIQGVTRAFTHQLVRTRNASYAQESLRTVKFDGEITQPDFDYIEDEESRYSCEVGFKNMCLSNETRYNTLIELGARPQDARGILPTNLQTGIVAKFNLRTLHEMANLRLCTRTQGEYQNVFREMRDLVYQTHEWTQGMLEVFCVNYRTCAFPNYKGCPIKEHFVSFLDSPALDEHISENIRAKWEETSYEAAPKATGDGRSED